MKFLLGVENHRSIYKVHIPCILLSLSMKHVSEGMCTGNDNLGGKKVGPAQWQNSPIYPLSKVYKMTK